MASCSFLYGLDQIPQLDISESPARVFLEDNRFENHAIGLRSFRAHTTASCNVWKGNGTGIVLDTLSSFDARQPNGKNLWDENGIHIRCHSAHMPSFQFGANTFNDANDALLLGTLHYPLEEDSTPDLSGSHGSARWKHVAQCNGQRALHGPLPRVGV